MTVITGQSNGKKAYGKYSSAPTFNVPIMKVPLTPQGINELTAAPASAKVRVKYFLSIPQRVNEDVNVSPGKIIDKYCSPTSKLIPTELKAVKAINLAGLFT